MNPTAVVQAANDFPWGLVLITVLIVGGIYVWRSGMLGKENEDKIKAERAKIAGAAAQKIAGLTAKLNAMASPQAMVDAVAIPSAVAAAPRDKAVRILEAKALLDAGTITQPQYDAAVAKIVAE